MEAEDLLWDRFDAPNLERFDSATGAAEAEVYPEIEGLADFHQLIYELDIWAYGLLMFPGYHKDIGIGETFQVDAVSSASIIPVRSTRSIVSGNDSTTPSPGQIVAIKSLRTGFSSGDDAPSWDREKLRKMIWELRILKLLSDLKCENVVKLLGVAWRREFSGSLTLIRPCLVLEYSEIGTLTNLVKSERGRITGSAKMGVLGDIAHALDFLLRSGIVHNDLKPDNILIFPKGEGFDAKLSDFGHSIYPLEDWKSSDRVIPGDEMWASPELLTPVQHLSSDLLPRVDVYSYGLLAWWLLVDGRTFLMAGNNVFDPTTKSLYDLKVNGQLQHLAIKDTRSSEGETKAYIGKSFRKIFELTLSKIPEDRVSSYIEILHITGSDRDIQRTGATTGRYVQIIHG
jgi:serine/threonine protein kinase